MASTPETGSSYEIIGPMRFVSRGYGGPDAACWRTNGDGVLTLLKPTVLLRRDGDGQFSAFCQVTMSSASGVSGNVRRKFLSLPRNNQIIFDPRVLRRQDESSIASENLFEFMGYARALVYAY